MSDQPRSANGLTDLEARLARAPIPATAAFRDRLRRDLTAREGSAHAGVAASGGTASGGTPGDRPSRHRPPRVNLGLAWGLAAAVLIAAGVAGAAGLQHYLTRRELAALPILPSVEQRLVGSGGKYGQVKVLSWNLAAPLPANPARALVYRPLPRRYTRAEAEAMAKAVGVTGGFREDEMAFRAFDGAGNDGGPGRLLYLSKDDARLSYGDYWVELGRPTPKAATTAIAGWALPAGPVDRSGAIQAVRRFLTAAAMPFGTARSVAIASEDHPGLWDVRLFASLPSQKTDGAGTEEWPVYGFQVYALVKMNTGQVQSANITRQDFAPVGRYPLRDAAEAFSELKTRPFYAANPEVSLTVEQVELVYFHYPKMDLAVEDTRLQPSYRFAGRDNFGNAFECLVTAVQPKYIRSGD